MSVDLVKKAKKFRQLISDAGTIAIMGHVRPDGDCIGSNLAMYNYIRDNFPDKKVDVYDGTSTAAFNVLSGYELIKHEPTDKRYDLAISIDVSELDRLGDFKETFQTAISTICIDHHVSNRGFGDFCYIVPDSSSACETMCDLLDMDKVSERTANCLYLGIIHDTGVFKYSSTTRSTMELAGLLIEKGARPDILIDGTFYKKSYNQNRLTSKVILDSVLHEDGRIISGRVTSELFEEFGCTVMETDGIVEQLRLTDKVEVAVFGYQLPDGRTKFSLRSKFFVDVNVIATAFGGGGHVRAAGFETEKDYDTVLSEVIGLIKKQFESNA